MCIGSPLDGTNKYLITWVCAENFLQGLGFDRQEITETAGRHVKLVIEAHKFHHQILSRSTLNIGSPPPE